MSDLHQWVAVYLHLQKADYIFFGVQSVPAQHRILSEHCSLHPIDRIAKLRLNFNPMKQAWSRAAATFLLIGTLRGSLALASAFDNASESDDGPAHSVLKITVPEEKKESTYQWSTSGDLKAEGTRYQSSIPGKSKLDQSLLVQAHLRPQLQTENTQSRLDFTAQKFTDWGVSDYTVREFYWDRSWQNEKSHLSLGRKHEYWSQVDHDWQLGVWQPKSILDALRPEEQGLTGVFYKHQAGSFEWLGLYSPLFIPTMGPQIKEEDGNLVADNRWYRSPSPTFVLFDQQRRVVYDLNIPDYNELVNKPGFGTRLSYGRGRDGFWASANVGYKPINSLVVKYDKKLALSEDGEDTGAAPLFPSVAYHTLWGGDLGYQIGETMVSVSYLEDQPHNESPKDPYIIQFANPMKAYSAHANTQLKVPGLVEPVSVTLGYLRIDGGDYRDRDHEGADQGAVFAERFDFYNAASIKAELKSVVAKKKMVSRFTYMREFEQKGLLTSAAFDFYPTSSLALTIGADVLGVDDDSADNRSTGFLNEFRANDRAYAGVSYVF